MVATRTKKDEETNKGEGNDGRSAYEKSREQRIKENMEKIHKLGIVKLSRELKPEAHPPKRPSNGNSSQKKKAGKSFLVSEPARRSSRLKDMTPVNYSEKGVPKEQSSEDVEIQIPGGSQPEIYTEEHDNLLGDCKTSWTLYVDGYDDEGNRIYDPLNGKTCHQCRQKTLGLHTCCSKCSLVQGQFCGDCLYMRYGENVSETNDNPDWICPTCRGICNCSRCRRDKGWMPTGNIYKKVVKLGFKSVAHYLIHTYRLLPKSKGTGGARTVVSAESCELDEGPDGSSKPQSQESSD